MKRLLSILIAITMMATMSVTAFAEETTPNIILELTDSWGDGWETVTIKACLVKSDGSEEILREGMTVAASEATYEFTVDKFAVVRFYWVGTEEYAEECGVIIKRDGNIQYEQLEYEEITDGALICSSEYFDPRSTTVTYQVDPTFTVTIPATVALGETATIKAENVVVAKGKQVEVTLTNANDFKVTTQQGASLTYTVTKDETTVNEGDTVLTVNPDNGKTGETTLTFSNPTETAKFAGDYTGSATFTIAVKDAPTISFTMDSSDFEEWIPGLTVNLQAEAGMTWAEWIESEYNVDGYVVSEYYDGSYYVHPAGEDWVAVRDTQFDGFEEPTDEIIADHTYTLIQIYG